MVDRFRRSATTPCRAPDDYDDAGTQLVPRPRSVNWLFAYHLGVRWWTAMIVVVLVGGGCSDSSGPEVRSVDAISVTVELPPEWRGTLIEQANGRVTDEPGTEVATFHFESAWDIPSPWAADEAVATGAATEVVAELLSAGTYTFELGEVGISGSPCGTCAAGYAETSTVVEVDDGSVVELPVGDPTWVS